MCVCIYLCIYTHLCTYTLICIQIYALHLQSVHHTRVYTSVHTSCMCAPQLFMFILGSVDMFFSPSFPSSSLDFLLPFLVSEPNTVTSVVYRPHSSFGSPGQHVCCSLWWGQSPSLLPPSALVRQPVLTVELPFG